VLAHAGEGLRNGEPFRETGQTLTFSVNVTLPDWVAFDANAVPEAGTDAAVVLTAKPGRPVNTDAGTVEGVVISVFDGIETVVLPPFDLKVLDTVAPKAAASPRVNPQSPKPFNTAQEVILSCDDTVGSEPSAGSSGCAAIHYTDDETDPKISGSTQTILFSTNPPQPTADAPSPINVSDDTTLMFFAVDADGNEGATVTEAVFEFAEQPRSL